MKKTKYLLIVFLLVVVGGALGIAFCYKQATASRINLPLYGFSIDALDDSVDRFPTQALMMFLAPFNGFASSVNVMIQPYQGTMDEYIAQSKQQFEEMKWEVVSQSVKGQTEWRVEYQGELQGQSLRWYARAILKDGKVYLATATAAQSEWEEVSEVLLANVESFKVH